MQLNYIIQPELKTMGINSTVVAEVSGINVQKMNEELEELKIGATNEIKKLDEAAITSNGVLEGYRELVRGIGRSLNKFPPAAENLIEQVRRLGRFPTINTAVDSYNIVVAKRFLALDVHDRAKLGKTVVFRLSDGGESFRPVGNEKLKSTQQGDFVYADEHRVLAWLDSKDSDDVKVSLDTVDLVIVVQGTARTPREYNWAAAEEASRVITKFCGGTFEIAAVD